MNERDLRDCFAMFAMMGLMASNTDWDATDPWDIADRVIEARTPKDVGIKAVRKTRKTNDEES